MCSVPPPPPLPPKPEFVTPDKCGNTISNSTVPENDQCKWATNVELREAFLKSKLCLEEPPFKCQFKPFDSISQEGPTCGIVALAMLLRGRKSAKEIFSLAKQNGFTNNGEMFSCKNMLKLATEVLDSLESNEDKYEIELRCGSLFEDCLIERLLAGSLLLVPYDADFNHSPCLKGGHKSHWALVCGIAIINQPEENYTSNSNNIHLLCKHGKSKHLALWNLKDLEDSNRNLNGFAARKGETMSMYVMPEGGVGGEDGLKNQFLIIDGL